MNRVRRSIALMACVAGVLLGWAVEGGARDLWTKEQAQAWGKKTPWLVGSNYIPSTAINQLEMWQAETFDPATIDRELGLAHGLGFNSMRVFLHDLAYKQDPDGFLKRVDGFLAIAAKHKIGVMLVLFDSVWDPFPKAGPQRAPKPGVHNSGWVQGPGVEILSHPERHGELEGYVRGVVGRFKDDPRVQVWDVCNEPDNTNGSSYMKFEPANKSELALMLLKKAYAWARDENPTQPLTSGVWVGEWQRGKLTPLQTFQLEESDVLSFHDYSPLPKLKARLESVEAYGRPVLCTEYMARPEGSRFDPCLAFLKSKKVGAYNWGFVDGKSQTTIPWDSWKTPYRAEPPVWFHDIFRRDGTPYDAGEVAYIRGLTGAAGK
ncbi:cellulase family glycosylhydrolase [Isosphaeraceae bacterium EP7]